MTYVLGIVLLVCFVAWRRAHAALEDQAWLTREQLVQMSWTSDGRDELRAVGFYCPPEDDLAEDSDLLE